LKNGYFSLKQLGDDFRIHQDGVREIELEREIGELRRANEILKDALGFFAKDRKR